MILFEDFRSLDRLNSLYWAVADLRSDEALNTLFHRNAVLRVGKVELSGIEDISRFFRDRKDQQKLTQRVTRHFSSGFDSAWAGQDYATASSVVQVYAGIGEKPFRSAVPSTVADVEDFFTFDGSRWKFQSRVITPVFISESAATFAR